MGFTNLDQDTENCLVKLFTKMKENKENDNLLFLINKDNEKINELLINSGIVEVGDSSLLNSEHSETRRLLAKNGYFLEELTNDKSASVRIEIAKQGKFLDKFVNDEDKIIRGIVAESGKYLEELKNDPEAHVRCRIAQQGYNLEEYLHDKDEHVRLVVAMKGYGLEVLQMDENRFIRDLVDSLRKDTKEFLYNSLLNETCGLMNKTELTYEDKVKLLEENGFFANLQDKI